MSNYDEILKKLQAMDPGTLRSLVQSATRSLSAEQQKKLKSVLDDPKKLQALKNRISDDELDGLRQNISDPSALGTFLADNDMQKRINEIL